MRVSGCVSYLEMWGQGDEPSSLGTVERCGDDPSQLSTGTAARALAVGVRQPPLAPAADHVRDLGLHRKADATRGRHGLA
jgi:hypothetical protein